VLEVHADLKLNQITNEVSQGVQSILGDKLRKIILYGSYARGDYNSESDVDIMVLADIVDDEMSAFQKALNKISSNVSLEYDITVSILLRDMYVFNTRTGFVPFYRNVLTEGVEVYAAQ
jgi:predicted nucleotidyltransferase